MWIGSLMSRVDHQLELLQPELVLKLIISLFSLFGLPHYLTQHLTQPLMYTNSKLDSSEV